MVEARFFVDFVLETVASSLDVFCGVVAHSELTMALEDVVRLGSGGDGTTKLLPSVGMTAVALEGVTSLLSSGMASTNALLEPCGFAGVAVSFLGTSAAAANSNIVTSSTEPLEGAPLVLQLVTGAKVGGEANGALVSSVDKIPAYS